MHHFLANVALFLISAGALVSICRSRRYLRRERLRDRIMRSERRLGPGAAVEPGLPARPSPEAALMPATGGLAVRKWGHAWHVVHSLSGLPALAHPVRLKRHAEEARSELYATGVDFTADTRAIQRSFGRAARVVRKWEKRVNSTHHRMGDPPDPQTGEWYGQ